jgi:tetratricopeptide (TPR) repeat protein
MIDLEGLEPSVRTQFEEAVAAARSSPEGVDAVSALALTLHAYGRPAAAVAFYRRARALEPRVARWAYLQGVAEAESGDLARAVDSLKECLAQRPQLAAAQIRLADLLALDGRPEESRPIYTSVLETGPSAAAHFGLGKIAAAEERLDEAVHHFETARELRPGFREAHYALGQVYLRLGEQAKSAAALERFEESEANLLPFDDPWMDDVAELRLGSFEHHFRLGRRHEQAGRINEALSEYLRAAELTPAAARVHVNLVAVYGRLQDMAEATKHYERALQLDPEIEELHYNYGVLLTGAERFDAAKHAFRRALEINPRYAEAHNNLGYALERAGRTKEAVAEYEAAIAAKPDYALPHIHLARRHLSNGSYTKAVPHLEEALRFEKDEAAYLGFLLARAYAETGDPTAAGKQAQAARSLAIAQGSDDLVRMIDQHFPAAP